MPAFHFALQPSFFKELTHPITVPKGQVSYRALESEGFADGDDLSLIFPRGERLNARLHHGDSGWGEYYQIRVRGNSRTLPAYMKHGEAVFVVLSKVHSKGFATLEYFD